jgi:hypothetical protein
MAQQAWTWQRDTELSDDELYALSEELTIIRASKTKLQALAELAENIPNSTPAEAVVEEKQQQKLFSKN